MTQCTVLQTGPPPGFDPDDITPPPLHRGPWRVSALALDVAGTCNLACRYCAEAATQPVRPPMSHDVLEAAWRFLYPTGRTGTGYSIRLGSGEPLLALPVLEHLARLVARPGASEKQNAPAVFITTNGTLVDGPVRDWLASSGWHVKLSIDGPASVHDRWRVTTSGRPTFDRVAGAARDLAPRIGSRLSATAVLCAAADPQQVFDAIADLGVQRIELVPVAHADRTILPGSDDQERYERFVLDYARCFLHQPQGRRPPTLVRFANRVVRVMGYDLQRIPCGAGRSFLAVAADGGIYPCFRFVGIERYRLGQLSTGLDRDALSAFQEGPGRPYEERAPCRDCWAAPLCGGPCFACAEMFGPGGGLPLAGHCAYVLADARSAVWLVDELRARAPEKLLSFLPSVQQLGDLV